MDIFNRSFNRSCFGTFKGEVWSRNAFELFGRRRTSCTEPTDQRCHRLWGWTVFCSQRPVPFSLSKPLPSDFRPLPKWSFLCRVLPIRSDKGRECEKKRSSIFAFPGSCMDRNAVLKGRLRASYTVEAAIVMAILLWAVVFSIQAAYRLRDEVTGAMALSETVERLRHNESGQEEEAAEWAARRAGTPFSWKGYEFGFNVSGNPLTGKKVKASGKGGRWSLEIEEVIFDPENFLRLISLWEQEEFD